MIVGQLATKGNQSIRKIASAVHRSKSAVHRHLRRQKIRNKHPESPFWETEAGDAWLRRMMLATLYIFGLDCHVGADKLAQFFKLIRIDTHVGVSPSALRRQLRHMEN
ncbi:MAG: hypothetical protein PHW13_09680 [Methylococcales bacterium]|nr:hypothetical protein [Methylococcales bacterium]